MTDASYQPLSRPLFIYVNISSAARAEANAFARFFVAPENVNHVKDVGYVQVAESDNIEFDDPGTA